MWLFSESLYPFKHKERGMEPGVVSQSSSADHMSSQEAGVIFARSWLPACMALGYMHLKET